MIRIERLVFPVAGRFAALAYPAHRERLALLTVDDPLIAVGAIGAGGEAVGLGLAEVRPLAGASVAAPPARAAEEADAEILSLFVPAECRGRGIEGRILERIEEELRRRKCRRASYAFAKGTSGYLAAPGGPLAERGWSSPEERFFLPVCSLDRLFANVPALSREAVDGDLEAFLLSDLDPSGREAFLASLGPDEREDWSDFFDPFLHLEHLEPIASVGARTRADGRLVGWVVATRPAPDRIAYPVFFVRWPWRRSRLAFALWAEALRRHHAAGVPFGSGYIAAQNVRMRNMFDRRFGCGVVRTSLTLGSEKALE